MREFNIIVAKFPPGHDLSGFQWQDFGRQSQAEFDEMLSFVTTLADRRAVKRLFDDNKISRD